MINDGANAVELDRRHVPYLSAISECLLHGARGDVWLSLTSLTCADRGLLVSDVQYTPSSEYPLRISRATSLRAERPLNAEACCGLVLWARADRFVIEDC